MKKMEVKMTMSYHFIPIKLEKKINTSVSGEVWSNGSTFNAGGNINWYNHFGKQFDSVLQNCI